MLLYTAEAIGFTLELAGGFNICQQMPGRINGLRLVITKADDKTMRQR